MITGAAIEVTQTAIDMEQLQQMLDLTVTMDTYIKAVLYVVSLVAGILLAHVIFSGFGK